MKKFSIIIPALRMDNNLGRCLDSVIKSVGKRDDVEILLIDNDPLVNDTASLGAMKDFVTIISEKRKNAYAARNAGIASAKGTNIVFCDSDCIVDPLWFRELEDSLQKSEVVCGVYHSFKPKKCIEFFQSKLAGAWIEVVSEVRFFNAGNAAVRRSVFDKIGFFDEDFPFSGDIDFGLRLNKQGIKVDIERRAISYHVPRESLRKAMRQNHSYGYGNGCIRKRWGKSAPHFTQRGYIRIISAFYHLLLFLFFLIPGKMTDRLGRKRLWHLFMGCIDMAYFMGYMKAIF